MTSALRAALIAVVVLCPINLAAADRVSGAASADELLRGCLAGPSKDATAKLAEAVRATPYSDARRRKALDHRETSIVVDDTTRPDEAQRTETSVTAFLGWDLRGPAAGNLEYSEGNYRMSRVEVSSGQQLTPWRVERTRNCQLAAPVANARKIFELYETLQPEEDGILISANRREISVFTFDPDRFDIELHFELGAPLAGLPAGSEQEGNSRLILVDGGPRYDGDPGPGVPVVKMTRAAFLSDLEGPADMTFSNAAIEPVVQRLSQSVRLNSISAD